MTIICAAAPHHLDDAYALFCSHREQPWSKSLFEIALYKPFSLVALHNARLVGVIVLSNVLDEAELEDICVDSFYRQQGIASALLQASISSLRANSIKQLHLEVRQRNEAAIRLYEGIGFVRVGERKGYYTVHLPDDNNASTESAILYNLCID